MNGHKILHVFADQEQARSPTWESTSDPTGKITGISGTDERESHTIYSVSKLVVCSSFPKRTDTWTPTRNKGASLDSTMVRSHVLEDRQTIIRVMVDADDHWEVIFNTVHGRQCGSLGRSSPSHGRISSPESWDVLRGMQWLLSCVLATKHMVKSNSLSEIPAWGALRW